MAEFFAAAPAAIGDEHAVRNLVDDPHHFSGVAKFGSIRRIRYISYNIRQGIHVEECGVGAVGLVRMVLGTITGGKRRNTVSSKPSSSIFLLFLAIVLSPCIHAQSVPACVGGATVQNINVSAFNGNNNYYAPYGLLLSSPQYPLAGTSTSITQYNPGYEGYPATYPNSLTVTFVNPSNSANPAAATNVSVTLTITSPDSDDSGAFTYTVSAFDFSGKTVWTNTYQGHTAQQAGTVSATLSLSFSYPQFIHGFTISPGALTPSDNDGDDSAGEWAMVAIKALSYQIPSCEFISLAQLLSSSAADQGWPSIAAGEPVNPSNGNEHYEEVDVIPAMGGNGPSFTRYYNSLDTIGSGDMGPGWRHSYSRNISVETLLIYQAQPTAPQSNLYSDATSACQQGWNDVRNNVPGLQTTTATYNSATGACTLSNGLVLPVNGTNSPTSKTIVGLRAIRDDGHVLNYAVNGSTVTPEAGVVERLNVTSGGFTLVDGNENTETYDSTGKLLSISDRASNTQTLSYNYQSPDSGYDSTVTIADNFGRSLVYALHYFNIGQRLFSVGYGTTFHYDNNTGFLTGVTIPLSNQYDIYTTHQYTYTDANWPTGLSSIIDGNPGNQSTYAAWTYDTQGRATSSQLAGGVQAIGFTYNANGSTTTVDAFQAQRTFTYQQAGNHMLSSGVSGAPCVPCGYSKSITYDGAGFVQSRTDYNNNVIRYINDDSNDRWRGLETSRTEAYGTAQARTITTNYDANFRLPHEIDEYVGNTASGTPVRKTVFTYDPATGGLTQKTVTDTATNRQRTWKYKVNGYGQTTQVDGPRSDVADVTNISYWPVDTSNPTASGQIYQITDALGHITTFQTYDWLGRPLNILDPNNISIGLSYWGGPAERLSGTIVAGNQSTSYDFNPEGQLQTATMPNGAYLNCTYNAAHQLTDVYDQLNDHIRYTPDAMGNDTETDVYDAGGAQVRWHQKHYNTLNQKDQDKGYYPGELAQYYYDNNNNQKQITDPLGHITIFGYDGLNRRYQITDPNTNNTTYALNALDQITSVTDPRTLATNYTIDALNNVSKIVSPDSGTTMQTQFDDAGNVISRTDANNHTTTYKYDVLNRLILLTRSDSSTVTYNYDQANDNKHYYGIGRLTSFTDTGSPSGPLTTVNLSYDIYGDIAERDVTVGGNPTLTTQWSYDPYGTGELQSITLPTGNVIGYNWNGPQLSNITLTTKAGAKTTLVSGIGYEPFGGPSSWTFANGEADTRFYDMDGRISSDPVESIGYDAAGRVNGWTLGGFYNGNTTFGYQDPMDFVGSQTDTTNNIALSYTNDANGNRSKQTAAGKQTIYTIDPSSNRITKSRKGIASPITYTPDADGSITGYGGTALTYDTSERLIGYGSTASYAYDGLGTRVAKTVGSAASTLFNYDDQKHLLGEYTAGTTNKLVEETVYMGDVPVAVVKPLATYYVHADYRNAPRQIDNRTKAVAWAWYPQPYGDSLPNNNPAGLGAFVYNLRYPGQYYDTESGFMHNGARYYDPATGRYLQSDPLGMVAGVNTFSYVLNRPLDLVDPLGLCSNGSDNNSMSGLMMAIIAIQGMAESIAEGGMTGGAGEEEAVAEEFANEAETIPLYRVVGPDELVSIEQNGSYTPSPGGLESKYFYPTAEQAAAFAANPLNSQFGPYTLTSTGVPISLINPENVVNVAGEGRVITIPNEQLPSVPPPSISNSIPLPVGGHN